MARGPSGAVSGAREKPAGPRPANANPPEPRLGAARLPLRCGTRGPFLRRENAGGRAQWGAGRGKGARGPRVVPQPPPGSGLPGATPTASRRPWARSAPPRGVTGHGLYPHRPLLPLQPRPSCRPRASALPRRLLPFSTLGRCHPVKDASPGLPSPTRRPWPCQSSETAWRVSHRREHTTAASRRRTTHFCTRKRAYGVTETPRSAPVRRRRPEGAPSCAHLLLPRLPASPGHRRRQGPSWAPQVPSLWLLSDGGPCP